MYCQRNKAVQLAPFTLWFSSASPIISLGIEFDLEMNHQQLSGLFWESLLAAILS